MCLSERQCVFQRDNVSSGDTMWLSETWCPSHKLTSRSSPDMFPASIRIKMMRETHWWCQKYPEYLKNHENPPPKKISQKNLNFFGKKYVDVKLKIRLFCGFRPYGFENRESGGARNWGVGGRAQPLNPPHPEWGARRVRPAASRWHLFNFLDLRCALHLPPTLPI